jgi:hypothetical protein
VQAGLAPPSVADVKRLKARMQERLPADSDGRITYAARAKAGPCRICLLSM